MSWDDIDVFCHVVMHGGFTSAADVMSRSKSSVSTSVNRLEASLKARLLDRNTRHVRMTEIGESLFYRAMPHLDGLRSAALEVQKQRSSISGQLSVAAPYEFGAHHLSDVCCNLMSQYPELNIVVDVTNASIDLFEKQYDVVFSMTDRDLASSSIVATRVFTLYRALYATPDLLAQHDPLEDPGDLAELPLLVGPNDRAWSFLRADGTKVSVPITAPRLRSANAVIRKRAAVRGLGIACMTKTYCEDAVRAGQLTQLLGQFRCAPLRVYALLPARRLMPPKVRLLLDSLNDLQNEHLHVGEH